MSIVTKVKKWLGIRPACQHLEFIGEPIGWAGESDATFCRRYSVDEPNCRDCRDHQPPVPTKFNRWDE
jgi:hypothetical protein